MEWVAIIASALSIVLWVLRNSEKTKVQKAREIISKARAESAKDRYYGQVRDTDEQERRNDKLLADVAAILSVRKKANTRN